jgi:hypothetical protein
MNLGTGKYVPANSINWNLPASKMYYYSTWECNENNGYEIYYPNNCTWAFV